MGFNYRCTDRRRCGKRVTLKQPYHHYAQEPVCPECGGRIASVNAGEVIRNKRRGCFCRGNGWPHTIGRIESEYLTCVHADFDAVEAAELGAFSSKIVTGRECPF